MKNFTSILIVAIFITSCGFKVVDRSRLSNFEISEINTKGDKKVGYIIRNKLMLYSSSGGKELISINLDGTKKKIVREKNIKNEITKYQISIIADVKYSLNNKEKIYQFSKSKTADYNVQTKISDTLNNEKRLIKLLTESLAQEIVDELIVSINAI